MKQTVQHIYQVIIPSILSETCLHLQRRIKRLVSNKEPVGVPFLSDPHELCASRFGPYWDLKEQSCEIQIPKSMSRITYSRRVKGTR